MMAKKYWNQKVDESDYVKLMVIVGVLVLAFFIYVTFVPKGVDSSLSVDSILSVDVFEISANCADCVDFSNVVEGLSAVGVGVDEHEVFAYDSEEGKELIEEYGIERVPALIVVSDRVDEMGLEEVFDLKDGYGVFKLSVPYLDRSTGEVKGLVKMIEISPDCENCFPLVPLRTQLEQQLGVKVVDYEIVEAESVGGLELIAKYGLNFAPALLISKDIDEYDWLVPNLGSVLEDKGDYYLFKDAIAPYKDLVSEMIKGNVEVTLINDSSCEDCFNVNELVQAFRGMGVYFSSEKVLDISSSAGKAFAKKYNVTKVPTVVLSKDILDYSQVRAALDDVGTFDSNDQSFVFRNLDEVGKYVEVSL